MSTAIAPERATLAKTDTMASDTAWIVVAAYNEEKRLARTLRGLLRRFRHVIVVDDGSTDGTAEVARKHDIWLLRHIVNRGQGAALQTGIDFALARDAQVIVTFDADGQHRPDEIAQLIEPIVAGETDVVLGSRFLGKTIHMPRSRRLLLYCGVIFTRVVSRVRITDAHNGLRAFSRKAASLLRITQDRMAHASEILDQVRYLDLRYREAPVTIRYSAFTLAKGQSSWNALKIVGQLLLGRFIA